MNFEAHPTSTKMSGTAQFSSPCPVKDRTADPLELNAIDRTGRQQKRPRQTHRVSSDSAVRRPGTEPSPAPLSSVCPQRTLQRNTLPGPPAPPRPEIRAGRPMALGDHLPGSRPHRPAGRPCWLPRRLSHTLAKLWTPWRNGSSGMYGDPRTKRRTRNRLTWSWTPSPPLSMAVM